MKSRLRPFQVEVRRSKATSNQPEGLAKPVLGQPLGGENGPKRGSSDHITREPRWPAEGKDPAGSIGSPPAAAAPPVRRILPDLRPPSAAHDLDSTRSDTPRAKRSTSKSAPRRHAEMRTVDDDEKLTSDRAPKAPDPNAIRAAEDIAPPVPAATPPAPLPAPATKSLVEAAHRFYRRPKPVTRIPRSERWKERRLPPVCRK